MAISSSGCSTVNDCPSSRRCTFTSTVYHLSYSSSSSQAARDQVTKERESMQRIQASGTMSRGGSRRGGERTEFGPDGWSVAGSNASSRPPQTKAGDLSKFGTFSSKTGPAPATFGPSKAFSKRDGKGVDTPVLSRQTSSANMFSALNSEVAAENPPTSSSSRAPSRKPSLA